MTATIARKAGPYHGFVAPTDGMSKNWCTRCPRPDSSGWTRRFRAEREDHLCEVCRKLQNEAAKRVDDPCDRMLVALLGDPTDESSTKYPRRKPAGPKAKAAIRLALAGKGSGQWAELAGRLLPGEVEIVRGAIEEASND